MVRSRLGGGGRADLYDFNPRRLRQSAASLPQPIAEAAAALRQVTQDDALDRSLRLAWLNRVTGFGFVHVPAPLPRAELRDEQVVRGRAEYPVVWLEWGDGRLAVSANGHSFAAPAEGAVVRLLERLNEGEPCEVGRLVRGGGGVRGRLLREVLEKLLSLRALVVERPGEA